MSRTWLPAILCLACTRPGQAKIAAHERTPHDSGEADSDADGDADTDTDVDTADTAEDCPQWGDLASTWNGIWYDDVVHEGQGVQEGGQITGTGTICAASCSQDYVEVVLKVCDTSTNCWEVAAPYEVDRTNPYYFIYTEGTVPDGAAGDVVVCTASTSNGEWTYGFVVQP